VSAGYCCFFVLRSHSPARQRCNDRRIRTSSSPLIPRRIASLVLPACRSSSQDDLFGDGTTTPEHLPAMPIRTRLPGQGIRLPRRPSHAPLATPFAGPPREHQGQSPSTLKDKWRTHNHRLETSSSHQTTTSSHCASCDPDHEAKARLFPMPIDPWPRWFDAQRPRTNLDCFSSVTSQLHQIPPNHIFSVSS